MIVKFPKYFKFNLTSSVPFHFIRKITPFSKDFMLKTIHFVVFHCDDNFEIYASPYILAYDEKFQVKMHSLYTYDELKSQGWLFDTPLTQTPFQMCDRNGTFIFKPNGDTRIDEIYRKYDITTGNLTDVNEYMKPTTYGPFQFIETNGFLISPYISYHCDNITISILLNLYSYDELKNFGFLFGEVKDYIKDLEIDEHLITNSDHPLL